jgi:hypothetical protein
MLLFVIGAYFRRRRRGLRYSRDELPMAPLIRVLAFCGLLGMGGLLGIVALCAAYVRFVLGLPLDSLSFGVGATAAVFSPVCVFLAMRLWFGMRRADRV